MLLIFVPEYDENSFDTKLILIDECAQCTKVGAFTAVNEK